METRYASRRLFVDNAVVDVETNKRYHLRLHVVTGSYCKMPISPGLLQLCKRDLIGLSTGNVYMGYCLGGSLQTAPLKTSTN